MEKKPHRAVLRNSILPKTITMKNFTSVFDSAAMSMVWMASFVLPPAFSILAIDRVMASTSVIPEMAPAR